MMSAAEIGITDCTTLIGTAGRLTSVSVASTGRIHAPTPPSSTKKAITSSCATMPVTAARPPRQLRDELGAADVRALDRRQRRAVEREPREQHRRDLVVPRQRVAARPEHDAERHLDGERHHQRDDDPLEQPAVASRKRAVAVRVVAMGRRTAGVWLAHCRNATARSITSFAPGTSVPNSS